MITILLTSLLGLHQPLADAMMRTVSYAGGTYHKHCRKALHGCKARIDALAYLFTKKGNKYQVPPLMLAAIAHGESRFNPFAIGAGGERGVMQLHPRRKGVTKFAIFKHPEDCTDAPDACQTEVIDEGARILASARKQCGDWDGALQMYNSGRCDGAPGYARKVLRKMWRLGR